MHRLESRGVGSAARLHARDTTYHARTTDVGIIRATGAANRTKKSMYTQDENRFQANVNEADAMHPAMAVSSTTEAGLSVVCFCDGRCSVVEGLVQLQDCQRTYALTEQNGTHWRFVYRGVLCHEQQVHRKPDTLLAGIPRVVGGGTELQQSLSSSSSSVAIQPTNSVSFDEEKERHAFNHLPLRSWRKACAERKGSDGPHRQQCVEDAGGQPVVGFDHACVSLVEGRKDRGATFKTVRSSNMAAIKQPKEVTNVLIRFVLEAIEE